MTITAPPSAGWRAGSKDTRQACIFQALHVCCSWRPSHTGGVVEGLFVDSGLSTSLWGGRATRPAAMVLVVSRLSEGGEQAAPLCLRDLGHSLPATSTRRQLQASAEDGGRCTDIIGTLPSEIAALCLSFCPFSTVVCSSGVNRAWYHAVHLYLKSLATFRWQPPLQLGSPIPLVSRCELPAQLPSCPLDDISGPLGVLERHCPRIQTVVLRQICCGSCNLDRLQQFLRVRPSIRRLCLEWSIRNVEGCCDLGFIAEDLEDLEVLALKGRHSLSSSNMVSLALSHPGLRALSLQEWYGPNQQRVNAEALSCLLSQCRRLAILRLQNIHVALQGLTLPSQLVLRHLELCDVPGDATEFVEAVARSSGSSLQYLGLEGCTVRDQAFAAVATHCSALVVLDITDVQAATDACLYNLAEEGACPALLSVHLSLNEEIDSGRRVVLSPFSHDAIVHLVASRPHTRFNDLGGRRNHTFEQLSAQVDSIQGKAMKHRYYFGGGGGGGGSGSGNSSSSLLL